MSKIDKRISEYRQGDDWRTHFNYLNYTNVEAAVRRILTTKEKPKIYDRLGNHVANGNYPKPLTLDETIFRIMVLLETQLEEQVARNIPVGDYEADLAQSKVYVGSNPPDKFGDSEPRKDG